MSILLASLLFVATAEQQVVSYLFDKLDTEYIQKKYPNRLNRSLGLVPLVVTESSPDIDPLLVAHLAYWESRWDPKARGKKRGEIGIMQVHGKAKGGYAVGTPEGQLKAGIAWLKRARNTCGTLKGALNMYGSGKCAPLLRFSQLRYKWYLHSKHKYAQRIPTAERWSRYQLAIRTRDADSK